MSDTTKDVAFYEEQEKLNDEQKCPVVLVVDKSGSMGFQIGDQVPMEELNKGMKAFETEIQMDEVISSKLDIAVVSFGSDVTVERDFGLLEEQPMPTIQISGSTRADLGLHKGLELIRERKKWYNSTGQLYHRPYLIYITDGGADYPNKMDAIAKEIEELGKSKSLNFWPIAVEGADMALLDKLAIPGIGRSIAPVKLTGLNFVELFEFLSSSFSKVTNSQDDEPLDLTPEKGKNPFQFTV